ncbi:cell division protein FtsL [Marinobacterium weihaiense]|uniref:Cell division protein FtsL n=1 Tax=Marinobacterium weihaiense TaxID=2851016 RepID=A0ABS6M9W0_9GAMM|nr:cell division protein FtsL [Marinobacterium weihaiense]MBV0932689.1 cell division protein FtsL [Marinobacterium weihaiense]
MAVRLALKWPDIGGQVDAWQEQLKVRLRRWLPERKARPVPVNMLGASELAGPVVLVLLLTLMVMGSAMAVIFSAYEYRRLFNEHQVLVRQWDELQVEWGQYLLEQSVWSAHHRIEALATSEMDMVIPATEAIEIVRYEQQ